jgi:hypothetical protein
MNKTITVALALFAFSSSAWASDTAAHTVTVTVSAINEVSISGGNVNLAINSGSYAAADSSTADLLWSTNESNKKITVESSLTTINYPLTVEAQNVTGGTSGGVLTLSSTPQDLVTGISLTDGTADLAYAASSTSGSGVGSDAHTVTYTITPE